MLKTWLAIGGFLLSFSAEAKDPIWINVGTSDHAKISIDAANVRFLTARVIQAWVLFDLTAPEQGPDGRMYQSQKQLTRFDCSSDRYALVSMASYPAAAGAGSPVQNWDSSDAPLSFMHTIPGSVMDAVMSVVCNLKQPR